MGYETLKNILDDNREERKLAKQEAMNPTRCPVCDYSLDINSEGNKSCSICGWLWHRKIYPLDLMEI